MMRKVKPSRCAARKKRMIIAISRIRIWFACISSDEWKDRVRASIPELPDARKARYTAEFGLPSYDAEVITSSKKLADFFEESLQLYQGCQSGIQLDYG